MHYRKSYHRTHKPVGIFLGKVLDGADTSRIDPLFRKWHLGIITPFILTTFETRGTNADLGFMSHLALFGRRTLLHYPEEIRQPIPDLGESFGSGMAGPPVEEGVAADRVLCCC